MENGKKKSKVPVILGIGAALLIGIAVGVLAGKKMAEPKIFSGEHYGLYYPEACYAAFSVPAFDNVMGSEYSSGSEEWNRGGGISTVYEYNPHKIQIEERLAAYAELLGRYGFKLEEERGNENNSFYRNAALGVGVNVGHAPGGVCVDVISMPAVDAKTAEILGNAYRLASRTYTDCLKLANELEAGTLTPESLNKATEQIKGYRDEYSAIDWNYNSVTEEIRTNTGTATIAGMKIAEILEEYETDPTEAGYQKLNDYMNVLAEYYNRAEEYYLTRLSSLENE